MSEPPQPADGERDPRGRFAKGNRTSRLGGNPRLRHLGELQGAVRGAVDADGVRNVLARLQALAIGGDVAAAKLLLDRCIGTAAVEEHAAPVVLDGCDLHQAAGLAEALSRIVRAAAAGELSLPSAERLAGLLARMADSIVLQQLEARVEELDAEAQQ